MKNKVEILAPAGSFESMKAAVAAGADLAPGPMPIIPVKICCLRLLIMRICMDADSI